MHRARRRLSLRLQLTLGFVAALLAVEGAVLVAYWVSPEEPLVEATTAELRVALDEVRATAEERDLYLWRHEELAALALRAEIDILSVVEEDGSRIAGDEALFPAVALEQLLAGGAATWTVAAVDRTDPAREGPAAYPADPEPGAGGILNVAAPAGAAAGKRAQSSVLRLPEWPVVGAAAPFRDVFDRRAVLVGARTAPAAAPPLLLRAVTWMGLIGLFSATVAAWVVIGRALRPLRELAASAQRISPEHRDERLVAGGQQAEVEAAKRALNQALDRLEAGYDALDLFIGNVTHELRTPIASVLAEARQLALRPRAHEEYAAFVASTGDEMARLAKMIQSFLTLARMDWEERSGLVVPVPLLDVVVDVTRHVGAAARQQGVRVVLQLPEFDDGGELTVEGDADLLGSMLENVVRNALRFSPVGAAVNVTVTADLEHATLSVRDHGPGIPPSLVESVFRPFVQGEASPPGTGRGSGIGLAIAQKVVELHHGTIRIDNHAEGGCEVVITLPLTGAAAA